MADLIKAKDNTDKQLVQATMNLEVADASNRALLREVQEARAVITRLSATVARSAGWEDRLATLAQERDDLRQERDGETMRARTLEVKVAALSTKCGQYYFGNAGGLAFISMWRIQDRCKQKSTAC
jgi:hypothetical protein